VFMSKEKRLRGLSRFVIDPWSRHHLRPILLQYGAAMVESSVKTISKPVINRLPVGQIDEFACRQLDRVSMS
jgi:hypothetical protein